MNEQNLKPAGYKLSVEEAKKGGLRSAEVRRQKRTWREIAETLGQSKVPDSLKDKIGSLFSKISLNGDMTHDAAVIATAFRESESGNVQAMRFLADIKGELTTKIEADVKADVEISKINIGKLPDDLLFKMVEALDNAENNNE